MVNKIKIFWLFFNNFSFFFFFLFFVLILFFTFSFLKGYFHNSFDHQVERTKEKYFSGVDVVVLQINPKLKNYEVRIENVFPHIYSQSISWEAVEKVIEN